MCGRFTSKTGAAGSHGDPRSGREHSRAPRGTRRRSGKADAQRKVFLLALRQHGLVSRRQLLRADVPSGLIDRWVQSQRMQCVQRGVYSLGPVSSPRAREMAAVLACGPGAVLSHRSAAVVWQLIAAVRGDAPVDVIVREEKHQRPGVCVHRTGGLRPDETTRLDAIPITTVTRTVADLAGSAEDRELEQALAFALARRLTTRGKLRQLLARHPRLEGRGRLRALIDGEDGPAWTQSEAEEELLELVRRAQLPMPCTNVELYGFRVDFLWRNAQLVVEVDGFRFHSSRDSFEKDRRRDAVLTAAGLRVMRVTARQLKDEREAVLVRLGVALGFATC